MSLAPDDRRHGTVNGYCNLACRCQPCRDAWAAWTFQRRRLRQSEMAARKVVLPHGRATTYRNWMCRCEDCRDAVAAERRLYNRRAARPS